jgi:hypothetical protein
MKQDHLDSTFGERARRSSRGIVVAVILTLAALTFFAAALLRQADKTAAVSNGAIGSAQTAN